MAATWLSGILSGASEVAIEIRGLAVEAYELPEAGERFRADKPINGRDEGLAKGKRKVGDSGGRGGDQAGCEIRLSGQGRVRSGQGVGLPVI